MSNASRIAIVGGGIAGLIAAIEAARGGASATLFERAPELGGRARSRVADGFVFNQGPHALYRGGEFARTLAAYGVPAPGAGPDLPSAAAIWGESRHPLPVSFSTIAAGAPLGLGERARLLRLFAALPRLELAPWRGKSFADFTAAMPVRLRALVHALARLSTYAHAPDALDAAAALAQLRLAAGGVVYVDGGWGALVDGLTARAASERVSIWLNAQVTAIERVSDGWRLGLGADEGFVADAVMIAAPPTAAATILASSRVLAEAARACVPIRAVSLDYGLRRLPAEKSLFAIGIDRPLYFSVHSASARLAPAGGALVHAARYLGPDEPANAEKIGEVVALVERLQPGFEAEVVETARLIGMPVTHDFPNAARAGQMAPVALADAQGVFLAGDWVGEGAMLSDASAKSAREAANLALAHTRRREAA